MTQGPQIAAIDHLVLPVASLEAAEKRLAALGFQVAPRGKHPFGTENACVYLADGAFLEPLAIADARQVEAAAQAENVFTARDADFRRHVAPEGLSALVLTSDDARADHARAVAAGVSAGPILDFSRPFVDGSGKSDEASFRLAFAAPARSRGTFFFSCQRVHVPSVDRSALTKHPNGALALREATMTSDDPTSVARVVEALADGVVVEAHAEVVVVRFDGGAVLRVVSGPAPLFTDVTFAVEALEATAALLAGNQIAFEREQGRISVEPAPGQGVTFVFEEKQ